MNTLLKFMPAVIVFAAPHAAWAQSAPANEAVDTLFAEFDRDGSPGCALGVIQDGSFVYKRDYGMANLEHSAPIDSATVFHIASVSKQFTAAVVGLLALEGRISLDDDVRRYIPELPDYGDRITIRHLVHHTSGLRESTTLAWFAGLPDGSARPETLDLILRQTKLTSPPGQSFRYSNSGYVLLAHIVERVTGKAFREVVADRIFRPLGMTNTHVHDKPGHVIQHSAIPYAVDSAGVPHLVLNYRDDPMFGDAGVHTTIADLAKWDRNFYTLQVGGDGLHELMHSRGILNGGDTIQYAFGLQISEWRGLRIVEHDGRLAEGNLSADILRFPEERFSVLLACNTWSNPRKRARQVADLYLDHRMGPLPPPPERRAPVQDTVRWFEASTEELAEFAGSYYSPELDAYYEVAPDETGLVMTARNVPPQHFQPSGVDIFTQGPGCEVRFERGADDAVDAFLMNCTVHANDMRFRRLVAVE